MKNAFKRLEYFRQLKQDHPSRYEEEYLQFEAKLSTIIKKIPYEEEEIPELTKKIQHILSLPYWKYRYALYSAWISTQIIKAVPDNNVEYHVKDGKLSFSFGGSKIASFKGLEPELTLYAELKTPCTGLVGEGRKGHIQPDYSLVIDGSSDVKNGNQYYINNTILVVECKQYKTPSKRNFENAVRDYAKGRPNAKILLADYGPMYTQYSDDIKTLMDTNRAGLLGTVNPSQSAVDEFAKQIKDVMADPERKICYKEFDKNIEYVFPVKVHLEWKNLLVNNIPLAKIQQDQADKGILYFPINEQDANIVSIPFNPAEGYYDFVVKTSDSNCVIQIMGYDPVLMSQQVSVNPTAATGIRVKMFQKPDVLTNLLLQMKDGKFYYWG